MSKQLHRKVSTTVVAEDRTQTVILDNDQARAIVASILLAAGRHLTSGDALKEAEIIMFESQAFCK